MKELEARKAIGPDQVSGYTLRRVDKKWLSQFFI